MAVVVIANNSTFIRYKRFIETGVSDRGINLGWWSQYLTRSSLKITAMAYLLIVGELYLRAAVKNFSNYGYSYK